MPEQSKELVTSKDGVWRVDVDTFVPNPEGFLKIGGVEYPVYNFLDIVIKDSLKVARLSDDIQKADGYDERLERSIEQVILLNKPGEPKLSREIFDGMTPKQIITLTVMASSIAQVPTKAAPEENPSSSPSPSPESAASTLGGERASSA